MFPTTGFASSTEGVVGNALGSTYPDLTSALILFFGVFAAVIAVSLLLNALHR